MTVRCEFLEKEKRGSTNEQMAPRYPEFLIQENSLRRKPKEAAGMTAATRISLRVAEWREQGPALQRRLFRLRALPGGGEESNRLLAAAATARIEEESTGGEEEERGEESIAPSGSLLRSACGESEEGSSRSTGGTGEPLVAWRVGVHGCITVVLRVTWRRTRRSFGRSRGRVASMDRFEDKERLRATVS